MTGSPGRGKGDEHVQSKGELTLRTKRVENGKEDQETKKPGAGVGGKEGK